MNNLISYFKNYSIIRWIRLAVGLVIIAEAVRTGEFIVSIVGFALVIMALTKAGCDPANNTCAKPSN